MGDIPSSKTMLELLNQMPIIITDVQYETSLKSYVAHTRTRFLVFRRGQDVSVLFVVCRCSILVCRHWVLHMPPPKGNRDDNEDTSGALMTRYCPYL